MYNDQDQVIASGPYESEPVVVFLIKAATRYLNAHPQEARELAGSLQHIQNRKLHIDGPDGKPALVIPGSVEEHVQKQEDERRNESILELPSKYGLN